jgi:DNA-binding transcriptional ArsR family regulator
MQPLPHVQELDPILHEKSRLAIVSVLATGEGMTFRYLRDTLQMSDGNLSVHLRVLEQAGYVDVEKTFVGRKPQTRAQLNRTGRQALERYIDHLEGIVREVKRR